MSRLDAVFQTQHVANLSLLLDAPDGAEASAYALFGQAVVTDPWDRTARRRLLSHDVVPVAPEHMISADRNHVTWNTAGFIKLLKRAKDERLIPAIVHSHPEGPDNFSAQDDRNERELLTLVQNRNGLSGSFASVLFSRGKLAAVRLWTDDGLPVEATSITTLGDTLSIKRSASSMAVDEAFARQALAFGPELNAVLRGMKVAVVGCGGTGSATAMLLARLGVGQILLIDEDIVEVTNLNRLHGARRADADGMATKVSVVAREIAEAGLGVRAIPLKAWVGDPVCRDGLRSCDAILGCTDDHDGRLFLNRLAYFYLIPVIDMGLAIQRGPAGMRDLSGRVTVLTPGAPCLVCRGIVDPKVAREQALKREHPEDYERLKREAYVRGEGNPAPAVVTFTTATACMAVDELIQGLTGFRGIPGWVWHRTRRFDKLEDRRPGAHPTSGCPVCGSRENWGRGDVDPFLDRVG